MARGRATDPRFLRRLATAKKDLIRSFKEGANLVQSSGRSLDDLREEVTSERMRLAFEMEAAGDKLVRSRPRHYRSAISRYYYAMYHATRAVVYYHYGGDDHQEHSVLPRHLPNDFPNGAVWRNELKSARENRNSADYDPYAPPGSSWLSMAQNLSAQAPALVNIAETYLRGKGCKYL